MEAILGTEVPRIMWSLWMEGRDRAPELVRRCFEEWERLNPDWQLLVLDEDTIDPFLQDVPSHVRRLPVQALSDIIRIHVLEQIGGIWIDATVWPIIRLHDWLESALTTRFFAFERPGPDRPIASWFLCASPDHYIIKTWADAVRYYWRRERFLDIDPLGGNAIHPNPTDSVAPNKGWHNDRYPYFWFHYLFGYCVNTDHAFSELWKKTPKHSAVHPHRLQHKQSMLLDADLQAIQSVAAEAVVQKLDWRNETLLSLVRRLQGEL